MYVESKTFIRDAILTHLFPNRHLADNEVIDKIFLDTTNEDGYFRIKAYIVGLLNICDNELECCAALPPALRSVAFNMQGVDLSVNSEESRIDINKYKDHHAETVSLLQELMLVHLLSK